MPRYTTVAINIDKRKFLQEITTDSKQVIANELRKKIEPIIEDSKQELVSTFKTHPVTQEIEGGPNASNISGTLGGYGNLFSFMGFEAGSFPTEEIQQILNRRVRFSVRRIGGGTPRYRLRVFGPTMSEVLNASPLPWAPNLSWVDGVERGIVGLSNYIFKSKGSGRSRSGTGIQTKNSVSGVKFSTTPYVEKMLETFEKRIRKLES